MNNYQQQNNLKEFRMKSISCFIALVLSFSVFAQDEEKNLTTLLIQKDSIFWSGYNSCNIAVMEQYLATGVEFYHDKGGITLGVEKMNEAMRNNICGNSGVKIRREAVPGTFHVYPLRDGNKIYGAILLGDHYFYVTQNGGSEKREGLAKFTHLWLLKDNEWKMHRILSYDHAEAPHQNNRTTIKLSDETLKSLTGFYLAPDAGTCEIQKENNGLLLIAGVKNYHLLPESDTSFFITERDLRFEFVKNDKGNVLKFLVHENGRVVEEAVKQK